MKIINSQLKQIIKEEIEIALDEGAVIKIPVEKMDEFKRRLEKWAMHYGKVSDRITNDIILQPTDEQVEKPHQLTRITRKEGHQIRKQLINLNNALRSLMRDFDMQSRKEMTRPSRIYRFL